MCRASEFCASSPALLGVGLITARVYAVKALQAEPEVNVG